jgi:hypothetical protein
MIFMVFSELLAPNDQRVSPFLPDEHDGDHLGLGVDKAGRPCGQTSGDRRSSITDSFSTTVHAMVNKL